MKAGKNNQHELEIVRVDITEKCEQIINCNHCFKQVR